VAGAGDEVRRHLNQTHPSFVLWLRSQPQRQAAARVEVARSTMFLEPSAVAAALPPAPRAALHQNHLLQVGGGDAAGCSGGVGKPRLPATSFQSALAAGRGEAGREAGADFAAGGGVGRAGGWGDS
ncbi:MAG: hypothetical protein EBZ13_12915, partial [Planctomycetia bacterium]|nr:hypothetical protein [Planctomycetia bacterium]